MSAEIQQLFLSPLLVFENLRYSSRSASKRKAFNQHQINITSEPDLFVAPIVAAFEMGNGVDIVYKNDEV